MNWEIFYQTDTFQKIYEVGRIVNPITNEVLEYTGDSLIPQTYQCYQFWSRNQRCSNCVGLRSLQEQRSLIKLEYHQGKVFMVTAAPIEINGQKLIAEFLKDVSNSLVYDDNSTITATDKDTLLGSMNQLVLKDPLTGAYNRRFLKERFPDLIQHSYEEKRPLGLLMMDLDDFKFVNDTHGHMAGDDVLKAFVVTIKCNIRKGQDWVVRYGGEEFLACIPGAGPEEITLIAEKIRQQFQETAIKSCGYSFNVTASFGALSMIPQPGKGEELLNLVDQKLYEAKKAGKNRVILHQE